MEQPMTTKADASMSPYERYEDELVTLLQMPGVDVKPLPKICLLYTSDAADE